MRHDAMNVRRNIDAFVKVGHFSNDPSQDVAVFIKSINWKHGISKETFEAMSSEESDGLDDALTMYLYSLLEGEPARWFSNLDREVKETYKKVASMLITRYGKDDARFKRSQRQRVAAELNALRQGPRIQS
ncbi:hypothetical protein V498_10598 [Pseudogymnoascus sp. VKM F-4517 (FW-2822)]|nr:hypothetical protein V498_10598 [Pseudogymnoascus sp. VKM F-4517 (FW-2822)]